MKDYTDWYIVEEGDMVVARCNASPEQIGIGHTVEEAVSRLKMVRREWLTDAIESGIFSE